MKYRIFFLFFLVAISSFAQEKDFVIEGKIGSKNAPATVFLYYKDPITQQSIRDSVLLSEGKFTFTGTIEYPVYAKLVYAFNGDIRYATAGDERHFYIDHGKMTINGRQLFNAEIKGSATHDLLVRYQDIVRPVENQIIDMRKDRDDIYKPYSPQYRDSLDYNIYKLERQYHQLSLEFIEGHLNNILAIDMLRSENKANPGDEQIEMLFERLGYELKNSVPGQRLKRDIQNKNRIGKGHVAPEFTAVNLLGESVSLSAYKGKWVLLTFWSPTCDICHNEAKELKEVYAKYKERGFNIIAFAIEESHEVWEKATSDLALPYITISDLKAWSSPIAQQYRIKAVPENYLINPDGLIYALDLYGYELTEMLDSLLIK